MGGERSSAGSFTKRTADETRYWDKVRSVVDGYSGDVARQAMPRWAEIARAEQLPPQGDWRSWLL
ncbi:MAG: hypothetical protein KAG89_14900, partial [Fulvimarina manganoxydans]|nr:hypothetical protein [Fulvimarina manganoxydans]